MKNCVIIYNPQSGRQRKNINRKTLKKIASNHGYYLHFIQTRKNKDATYIASKLNLNKDDVLIATGGDGTLHEVIEGNMQRETRTITSLLPQGTVNDVGNMYGFTTNVEKDLEMLLSGEVKNVDTCLINNTPFVYVACFGNLVNVSFDTPHDLKEKYGKLGYVMYGAKEIMNDIEMYDVNYTVDNKTYNDKFSFMFITNTNRIAGINNVFNDVKLDDNKFEVILCKADNLKDCLKEIKNIILYDPTKLENSIYFKTNDLKIEFINNEKKSWCLDGEELKTDNNKFTFKIDQKTKMLLPEKNINKLFQKTKSA